MKRLGFGNGAIACLCVLSLARCGGRTESEWDNGESGGRAQGGNPATGGKLITPRTGGTGGLPATGTGGGGTGGKVSPVTGGVIGSGGTVAMCPAGMVSCANQCVDLQKDSNHCGSCTLACGDSGCVNGACVAKCPSPFLVCGVQCIDPETDPNFCGASGTCNGTQSGERCAAPAHCRLGRCESSSNSCLDQLNAGNSFGDGYYKIEPGPDPAQVETAYCDMTLEGGGWTRCALVTNNPSEDLDNNTWFDHCVDWTMAKWSRGDLLLLLRDSRGTLVYSARGKRNGTWTYDTITSTAEPNQQALPSLHVPLPLSTSDRLSITGRSASNQGCMGSQGNGYGILIAPKDTPGSQPLLRLMVMPYRLQVGSHNPRQFGFDNLQWSPSNEISFGAMAPFDTCGAPPPFLGWFEFYVR